MENIQMLLKQGAVGRPCEAIVKVGGKTVSPRALEQGSAAHRQRRQKSGEKLKLKNIAYF